MGCGLNCPGSTLPSRRLAFGFEQCASCDYLSPGRMRDHDQRHSSELRQAAEILDPNGPKRPVGIRPTERPVRYVVEHRPDGRRVAVEVAA